MRHRMHRTVLLAMLLGFLLSGFAVAKPAAAAPEPAAGVRYFPATGHQISGSIKSFYEANGDLAIFGNPLTELTTENGLQVQYFERARFELHPELPAQFYVSLTQLGRQLVGKRTGGAFAPAAPTAGANFYRETRHNVSGIFLQFWLTRGGLSSFGFPLSESFQEASPTDGVVRTVQYFERARFEYHPDSASAPVQLGLLGRQALDRSSVPASARKPVAPPVAQQRPAQGTLLGTATTSYFGSFSERINNIARGAAKFNGMVVQPGEVFSFNTALGDAGPDDGFVEGYAIVNGRLAKTIGGGLCQVSTTMYRAVFNAGLELVTRRNHTYVINFYENVPGWDATVFAPYQDFRWRNDTSGPIYISASSDPAKATVTFSLYGTPDGRKTTMVGPTVSNVVQQSRPIWQYDPTLKRGQTKQLVHGRPGMNVAMGRIVTAANGKVLHNDNLPSKYQPWEDFFLYGPGVTPPKGVTILPASASVPRTSATN